MVDHRVYLTIEGESDILTSSCSKNFKGPEIAMPSTNPEMNSGTPVDQLASIDREIIKLLQARASVLKNWRLQEKFSSQAAAESSKASAGSYPSVWDQQQMAVLSVQQPDAIAPLDSALASSVMRHIASACHHSVALRERIAYLGPLYSYSYLAATKHFGESAELVPVATIGAVFEEVLRNQSTWGMVPIENSTDGRIIDTLSMFAKHPLKICGEVLLPIHHCLLARCPRADVREVYSKPQAISQCRIWLAEHLPDAKLVEVGSTAAAARMASEKMGAAAIASREAGIHHGLEVVDENIEDNLANTTRFAVVGHDETAPTGNDKTSLMFRVPHKPGALADAMLVFRQSRLNLTWIESFPIPESPSEYLFFIELEGHRSQKNVAEAIHSLSKLAVRLEILGSYPRAS